MSASEIQSWFDRLDGDVRTQAEELVRIVHSADSGLAEAVKWGRLTFTVEDDWHHWVCGVAATKRGARLVFHKGVLLDDPEGLLQGSGRYVREVPEAEARRQSKAVAALVRNAIDHQRDMLD